MFQLRLRQRPSPSPMVDDVATEDVDPVAFSVNHYPAEVDCELMSTDGAPVHLRPIRPDDGDGLREFHQSLSARSVYRRFFFVHPVLSSREVERFTHIDYVDRLALVVEEDARLVAVGRYERLPGTSDAEVAFVVTDAWQHRGIGALLLEHLALAALATGITAFVAQTLAENRDMLNVFGHSGFPVTSTTEDGTVSIRFPIASDHAFRSACAARHRHLEVGSFDGEVPT